MEPKVYTVDELIRKSQDFAFDAMNEQLTEEQRDTKEARQLVYEVQVEIERLIRTTVEKLK